MLLLTGPTAAGKNTISHIIAKFHSPCAVVDFDLIRKMFVHPHLTPWEGEEGKKQQLLAIHQVCQLAISFKESGWEVIILDVLNNETLKVYNNLLCNYSLRIVQLLPSYEEVYKRFLSRGRCLTDEQFRDVSEEQVALCNYHLRLDNTNIDPETAARIIHQHYKENKKS